VLEGTLDENVTRDGRSLIVGSFVVFRVKDPLALTRTVGSLERAEERLRHDLRDAQGKAIGRTLYGALVAQESERRRWEEAEGEILALLRERVERQYRVAGPGPTDHRDAFEVAFVGIRRLALPEATVQRVFERMRAEREKRADELLAEGDALARRLRAEAEAEQELALKQAEADARSAIAKAEQAALEHHAVLAEDEDLAIFLRKLEALKRVLAKRSTIVLDTRTPPFDLLAPGKGSSR
jgi:membrane protease subunit HflC